MEREAVYAWSNRWFRYSVLALCALSLFSLLVGFVWLPSVQGDFGAGGLWASICRAAGVPDTWAPKEGALPARRRSTDVVLNRDMARAGTSEAIGRGATLALQCTMCHGARGLSEANAPNLAGQYPEVIIKQLIDFRNGDRISAVMQALASRLSDRDIDDLAVYYAYLPALRNTAAEDAHMPLLVKVGSPMRNIAPCASCHGGSERKLGAPWLEGMPSEYLTAQLKNFASGSRHNDGLAQMRNMVRAMSGDEIDEVARFYARQEAVVGAR
ncbi:MAG: c-type cytochrome [Caldimonas sp.]|nr:c-type cytochrome [Pseudomonadota bacterium]